VADILTVLLLVVFPFDFVQGCCYICVSSHPPEVSAVLPVGSSTTENPDVKAFVSPGETFLSSGPRSVLTSCSRIRLHKPKLLDQERFALQVYTHVLNVEGKGVKSTVDDLQKRNVTMLYRNI
jgi:hypothetical protein